MTLTMPLQALFNYIKKLLSNSYNNLKQPCPLLFLLFTTLFLSNAANSEQNQPLINASNIYSIVQDNKDFIWLAGQNGLHRFDGKQTVTFSNNKENWALPFNWINNISLKNEQLVLATETKGIWLFHTGTGKSEKINFQTNSQTFYRAIYHNNSYYAISMAPQNLYRYDLTTGLTSLIKANINNNLLNATKKRVYFNDGEILHYLKTNDKGSIDKVHTANINERIMSSASSLSTGIFVSKNKLFTVNDDGIIKQEETSAEISTISKSNDSESFILVNTSGQIEKRNILSLKKIKTSFPSVDKGKYLTITQDSSGAIWLLNNRIIKVITQEKIKNQAVTFNTRTSSFETEVYQGELYLGSYGAGVHILSTSSKNNTNAAININKYLRHKSLNVSDLLSVKDDLFIATFSGLWRYNKQRKITEKIELWPEPNPLNNIIFLKLYHQGNLLYIATDSNGLIVYDISKETVIKHITKLDGLSSGEVIDVLSVPNGDTWLATASGIDVINSDTNTIKNITKSQNTKFISLLRADNKIFVTTKGSGILVFDQQGNLLSRILMGVNFSYMSIVGDEIYASAKPALYRINPTNYQASIVHGTEKLIFTDDPTYYKNTLFVANTIGVLQLPIMPSETYHPKVYISKTTISGKSYLLNKSINISSSNDVITLDLASLDYRPGIKKQFRYRLNNSNWNHINDNQITLTGLASGSYHIEIMATNSLGQWSDFKAYTEINVAFPWYWTPKVRFIYAALFFGVISLVAWLLYLRSKSISHIHEILERDINNFNKTSLQVKRNLTLGRELIKKGELEKCNELLTSSIIQLESDISSTEPNSLDGKPLSLAIPFLGEYLKNKHQINLTYQLSVDENTLAYELQADLYRTIFEAISYAVIKGNGRNFKVILQTFKGKVWLNIYDDDESFIHFNSKVNFDISMYYIRQIANKYKGSINTFNEQNHGSQLVLSLPLNPHN